MRRVLIISMAILFVFAASSALMAGERQVSDRLLDILKDRQIITNDEYGELMALANKMQEDQSAVDAKLTALDRSVSEYLAKEGDAAGVTTTHMKAQGFGFQSGPFSLFIGGLFQFQYAGYDVEDFQDTNNFNVRENRFDFTGSAFVEEFTYRFQWQANGGVSLLDAFGEWDSCEWADIRFGQFKVPYSRQFMTDPGQIAFAERNFVTQLLAVGRDIGIAAHKVLNPAEGEDLAMEYWLGIWNGNGTNVSGNDNSSVAWGGRLGVYPMGMVAYGEGDFAVTQDPMFGIAGSYFDVTNVVAGTDVDITAWGFDAVLVWNGLYVTGEYMDNEIDPDGGDSVDTDGWFAQAGYMIPDTDFEVLGRYGSVDWDSSTGLDDTTDWAFGLAWYIEGNGHPFKIVFLFGRTDTDADSGSGGSGGGKFDDYFDMPTYSIDAEGKTNYFKMIFQLDW